MLVFEDLWVQLVSQVRCCLVATMAVKNTSNAVLDFRNTPMTTEVQNAYDLHMYVARLWLKCGATQL